MIRKSIVLVYFGFLLIIISCINNPSDGLVGDEFFPLRAWQKWTYKMIGSDMDTSRIVFPKQFTVSVVGEVTIADKRYFLMTNYFVPGNTLPDTVLVRNAGNHVFTHFDSEQEEHLFYSFSPPDTTWSTPMYVNPTTFESRKAILVYSNSTAAISWDLNGYPFHPPYLPGRTEAGWGETFKRGLGRTEIVSVSQVYGKIAWELENTQ